MTLPFTILGRKVAVKPVVSVPGVSEGGSEGWKWDDRTGVLIDWYRAADVAFVGGSLAEGWACYVTELAAEHLHGYAMPTGLAAGLHVDVGLLSEQLEAARAAGIIYVSPLWFVAHGGTLPA